MKFTLCTGKKIDVICSCNISDEIFLHNGRYDIRVETNGNKFSINEQAEIRSFIKRKVCNLINEFSAQNN